MTQFKVEDLQQGLRNNFETLAVTASQLSGLPESKLATSPRDGAWSVLEVLDHLNFYSRAYIANINTAFQKAGTNSAKALEGTFTPSWLGNYFTKMMEPQTTGKVKKMQAPKESRPRPDLNAADVIKEFLDHQSTLSNLTGKLDRLPLRKIKVATTLPLLRLNMGDTFRFVLAHQKRHFLQIERTLKEVG
jgi:hypothetical protein